MPRPFTGGAAVSPLPSAEGAGAAPDSPSEAGWNCGAAGFGAAVGAFFAPGRRAPGAIPSPLTSGSGLAGSAGTSGSAWGAAAAGGAGAAFLAPGRRAPAAMPRPLTSGSGLTGSARIGCFGSGGRGLLRAGTLGARGDAQPLGRRCSGGRYLGRGGFAGGGRCLLSARALGATGDTQTGYRLGLACGRCLGFRGCFLQGLGRRGLFDRCRGRLDAGRPLPRLPLPPCPFRAA